MSEEKTPDKQKPLPFVYKVDSSEFKDILENLVKNGKAERDGSGYILTKHGMISYISFRYQRICRIMSDIFMDVITIKQAGLDDYIRLNTPGSGTTENIIETAKNIQHYADDISKKEE